MGVRLGMRLRWRWILPALGLLPFWGETYGSLGFFALAPLLLFGWCYFLGGFSIDYGREKKEKEARR